MLGLILRPRWGCHGHKEALENNDIAVKIRYRNVTKWQDEAIPRDSDYGTRVIASGGVKLEVHCPKTGKQVGR
jgi:hypothetical protein